MPGTQTSGSGSVCMCACVCVCAWCRDLSLVGTQASPLHWHQVGPECHMATAFMCARELDIQSLTSGSNGAGKDCLAVEGRGDRLPPSCHESFEMSPTHLNRFHEKRKRPKVNSFRAHVDRTVRRCWQFILLSSLHYTAVKPNDQNRLLCFLLRK